MTTGTDIDMDKNMEPGTGMDMDMYMKKCHSKADRIICIFYSRES